MKEKKVVFRNSDLHYYCYGNSSDPAIILLHGYLETGRVWDSFAEQLAGKYYVICPDIPGHGKSGIFDPVHDMDSLAASIDHIVIREGIRSFHLVGHSMGGYVALAYCSGFAQKLLSCTLFHSTCFADTEEKKANRMREIDFIIKGKKDLIFSTNIPRTFADSNLDKFEPEIFSIIRAAKEIPVEGIISLLRGMMARPDRTELMQKEVVPFLLIAGKKDNYIPVEVMEKIKSFGMNIVLSVLENSGHMGFIEEPGTSAAIINSFIRRITKG